MAVRFLPLLPDDPAEVAGYILRARLGSGGMGTVYLSFSRGGRPVAIKVVKREFADDPEFRRRFAREVAAAQQVQGHYTAPVVDADPEAPIPWLATTYIAGPSLQSAVGEHGPFPLFTVFRLLAGAAEGIAAVHGVGLVHRDLKPANVLLAEDGPRVIDFGIAHAANSSTLTGKGNAIGTPGFMAPEQIRGGKVTEATDVFALGQLAVYAATGQAAFGEGPTDALFYRIINESPELGECPAELRPIVARCLAKDPVDRPSVSEVIDYARNAMRGETMRVLDEPWLPPPVAAALRDYAPNAAPSPATNAPTRHPAPPRATVPPGGPVPVPPPYPPATPRRPGLFRPGLFRPAVMIPAAAILVVGGYFGYLIGGSGNTPQASGSQVATHSPQAPQTSAQLSPATPPASPVASPQATSQATSSGTGTSANAAGALPGGYVPEYSSVQFVMPGESCEQGGSASSFQPSDVLFQSSGPKVSTGSAVGSGDLVYACNDGNNNGNTDLQQDNISIATVTGSPGAVACHTAILRYPIAGSILFAQLTPGMQFCMVGGTGNGQLVLLTLLKKSTSTYDLTWAATAWAIPAQTQ